MVEKDKIYTLKVEDFANEGKSIARIEDFVVFIDNAIPGDIAEVKIYKKKKSHAFGKAIKIIKNSEKRIEPRCKYFGICGGCKWQNMDYELQLSYKRDGIFDSFERIGKIDSPDIKAPLSSDDIFFFRNKMEFSFSDKRWLLESEKEIEDKKADFALGLHIPERFDKVLDIDVCFLQSENSTKILNFTREFALKNSLPAYSPKTHQGNLRNLVIREAKNSGQFMINLVTHDDNEAMMNKYRDELLAKFDFITTIVNNITAKKSQVATGESEKVYYGNGFIQEKLGDFIFQISANSFFQTNSKGTEKLYNVVKSFLPAGKINTLWDLYCGAGTISIFLSKCCNHIIGYELVDSAIKDAEVNIRLNKIENCKFVTGDLKDTIKEYSNEKPDVIILDPPRSGIHNDVLEAVVGTDTPQIIYVSCNPQTQARDLEILCRDYDISAIQPVDMFPHTMHIENVVKLIKKQN
jgi:23S rRNA (uracil1939-C5)-methyltransferase